MLRRLQQNLEKCLKNTILNICHKDTLCCYFQGNLIYSGYR